MSGEPILPVTDQQPGAGFWEAVRNRRLVFQQCSRCGAARMPPRPFCPSCTSLEYQWADSCGRGTIWSWIVVHPPTLPAFAELAPFPVALVELADRPGLRIVGNLVADADARINSVDSASLHVGMAVEVVFRHVGKDVTLPMWRPTGR
jgi:uncharacterized OB-fold protein